MASICVYCSSSDNLEPVFFEAAAEMGQRLASADHGLVYGGGSVGLMGCIARAVHGSHGHVVGVIPKTLQDIELAYEAADELLVVDTMRQRKQLMEDRADAFIAMAGGFGTLEELAEIIVGRHLKYHDKPIVLLNTAGFYDPLLAFFDELIERRFASVRYRDHYHVAATPEQAVNALHRALD